MRIGKNFGMYSEAGNMKIQNYAKKFYRETSRNGSMKYIDKQAKEFLRNIVEMGMKDKFGEIMDTEVRNRIYSVLRRIVKRNLKSDYPFVTNFIDNLWKRYLEEPWDNFGRS